ncbi:CPBP family intramembrane glutamic endopeptidase [Goekera deserti]|uniref:CPBP family intramembrane metalloprotease n=1 Tax=Goekera deserti TaxID=2497753 RepID=A0A7K3WGY3_9ACTN|nr:CPBP family intramembrane glutamic endopeptidase [Goekera deserti]NDI50170.1 CPBP family intramembrane metalloprotease [Goekera deserti]NEL55738.1 CPBP family intramembrane metalloprotease [Goekera deserti]
MYTGPPPTARYGAPPFVPRFAVPRGVVPWPPPPGGRPTTPPGAPPHDTPVPYLLAMRARDWAWWRPLLGLLLFTVLYVVAVVVVLVVVGFTGVVPQLQLLDLLQPAVLLLTNATLIVAIPIVWACWAVAHGLRIGWSSSVLGRLRWRLVRPWTLRALATVAVAALVVVLFDVLVNGSGAGPDSSFVWLALVVVTTTPLQAAAEEYVFRGYLSQTVAAWVRHERAGAVLAAVLTAALFSAAHAPPDVASFVLRFGFGLAASWVVWRTGGLEAAIVMHAVYNMTLFLAGGLIGTVAQTSSDPGSALVGTWLSAVVLLLGMAGFVHWVDRSRARLAPELLSPALDLRAGSRSPGARRGPWTPAPVPPAWGAPPWGAPGRYGPGAPRGYGGPAPTTWAAPPSTTGPG